MGEFLGARSEAQIRAEMAELGPWTGDRAAAPTVGASEAATPGEGQLILATWAPLLDQGRLQDGEKFLAGTAQRTAAKVSAATAQAHGLTDGDEVTVSTDHGSITAPVLVADVVDHVVWLPTNSAGSAVRATLGADSGTVVTIAKAATTQGDPR